jgi:prophage antirepressor-like protein
MNELQIFDYNGLQGRTVEKDGEAWWVLSDVCRVLELSDTRRTAERLDEDELTRLRLHSGGQSREMYVINESGLYNVILRSDKPQAKPFRKWVTSEVLPTIRKTGQYNAKPNKALEIKETNARVRLSNAFLKLAKVDTLSSEYKNILVAKAAEALTGFQLIPLPQSEQKMYTATEIGEMFGVSAQRIGKLSNQYGMKTEEYGTWYRSKSQYSNKEVDSFMYNDKAVERFKTLI